MESPVPEAPPRRNWLAIVACAAMLIVFAVLADTAAVTKSAVFDEPLHTVGGFVHRTAGDFRINPEDPALFGYIVSLPISSGAIKPNYNWERWPKLLDDFNRHQWAFSMMSLFQTPGVDGDGLIQRSRRLFSIIGVGLGAVIAWWSWRLAGATAAITATALYAFDPNFMAHAALVKNDVSISLLMLLLMIALWRFGRRGSWLSLLGITVTCSLAVNVKYSGLLFGPIIFLTLLVRALLPTPWAVPGKDLKAWWQRLLVVPAVCAIVGVASFVTIWGCYQFRFSPTPDPKLLLNTPRVALMTKKAYMGARYIDTGIELDETVSKHPVLLVDAIVWAESKRLLPQAWLHGLLYTYYTTLFRSGYLLGHISTSGWWYYFFCVVLFKTPTATLISFVVSAAAIILLMVWKEPQANDSPKPVDWWTVICLSLPLAYYGYNALTTNMNAGIRHILPMYPFVFIAAGCAIGAMIARWKMVGGAVAAILALGLFAENIAAWPNYLSFFNTPSNVVVAHNGYPGGFYLLGDSNLDWGQDLKLLAQWQKKHQMLDTFLSYFGTADPAFYGVHGKHVEGGWNFRTPENSANVNGNEAAYFIVSASNVQGIYYTRPELVKQYGLLRQFPPDEIIGTTLYVYKMPLDVSKRRVE